MTPWKMVMAVRWEAQVEKAFQSPPAEGILMIVTIQADSLPAESQGKTRNTGVGSLSLL